MRRKLFATVALLALSFALPVQAAPGVPVVDLPDTELTSPNVHWVTTFHTGTAVGGKFATIGGKQYFFQTTARSGFWSPYGAGPGGVYVFDASNPELPVLAGFLPIPFSQNEDVEISEKRNLLLYSIDNRRTTSTGFGLPTGLPQIPVDGAPPLSTNTCVYAQSAQDRPLLCRRSAGSLVVVDISMPNAPRIRSILDYPEILGYTDSGSPIAGPGHTASCILDCNYVYVSSVRNSGVMVIDLRNPDAPEIMGSVDSPAAHAQDFTYIHDVHVDRFRNVWMTGAGGTAMYAPITNPMKPKLIATVSPADNVKFNQSIHHGALRFSKDLVLITEEDFWGCPQEGPFRDGSFQTWKIDTKAKRLRPLASWESEISTEYQALLAENVGISCSSHWFDFNKEKVVADAFYEQGVRFLDISNPKRLRQVGYWIPPAGGAGQVQFVPGRPDLVYVSDYSRGFDVLRIDNGGKGAPTVEAPIREEWLRPKVKFGSRPASDEPYSWVCARAT